MAKLNVTWEEEEAKTVVEALLKSEDSKKGLISCIANWIEIAAQESRNTDYYRGLVQEIGEMLGERAYISDDGTKQEEVLCAKVPVIIKNIIEACKESLKIQTSKGNWDYGRYMHGMANGMLLLMSYIEGKQPEFLDAPEEWGCDKEQDGKVTIREELEVIKLVPDRIYYLDELQGCRIEELSETEFPLQVDLVRELNNSDPESLESQICGVKEWKPDGDQDIIKMKKIYFLIGVKTDEEVNFECSFCYVRLR